MHFVRMLFWVLILASLLIFTAFNWRPVEVQIWTNLVLETKIPALVIVAFLLGLLPTWLLHRGTKWRLDRRIAHLEAATRAAAAPRPVGTSPEPFQAQDGPSATTLPKIQPDQTNRPLP